MKGEHGELSQELEFDHDEFKAAVDFAASASQKHERVFVSRTPTGTYSVLAISGRTHQWVKSHVENKKNFILVDKRPDTTLTFRFELLTETERESLNVPPEQLPEFLCQLRNGKGVSV